MQRERFPMMDDSSMTVTRDALHAYARALGVWLVSCRPRRKHWLHASLRPSLNGLTTGVVRADIDFELDLNLRRSLLHARTSLGEQLDIALVGQPVAELSEAIERFLIAGGVAQKGLSSDGPGNEGQQRWEGYSKDKAKLLARVWSSVTASMESFRAGIREETSSIQIWPHHFDLAMLWFPGETIPGEDPSNEEIADKQMNFGFTFGDAGIPEPYFYVTAYPLPVGMPATLLPLGTVWQREPFAGAVLLYRTLASQDDPAEYLLDLWRRLLETGAELMLDETPPGGES